LEDAIHITHHDDSGFIESIPEKCFNEGNHLAFFARVFEDFLGIFAWIN